MPARRRLSILLRAGKATCRVPPVTSTLGLAGCMAPRINESAVRFGHVRASGRARSAPPFAVAPRCGSVQALRARQSQRSSSVRTRVSSGWRLAPACCAAQSVSWCAAHGRLGSSCRRRARDARRRQRFCCQRRYLLSCGRGLTGRSTGGAMAGHLARAEPFAYPAPRGQGVLPCPPGYLYVRPRGLHGAQAQRAGCARRARPSFRPRTERTALRSRVAVQVRFRRSAPGKASVLRRCAQKPVGLGASRRRAAPLSQSVGAPRTDCLARLAAAVHAAREGGSGSVANVGASAVVGAA